MVPAGDMAIGDMWPRVATLVSFQIVLVGYHLKVLSIWGLSPQSPVASSMSPALPSFPIPLPSTPCPSLPYPAHLPFLAAVASSMSSPFSSCLLPLPGAQPQPKSIFGAQIYLKINFQFV